ncbi:Mitotic spindle assembly checkpoint protein MAD2B [Geodia barretti]|uniref:Mitotic spindle assembly checkpoint protein MAD2B n=1 Tax=Geodia barretti TaxID=519541 RepID=A0AA35WJZ9_GEOBA|nr:Mitotic spindle assembly checkpoint protein MAD2B [Geodia barretti]
MDAILAADEAYACILSEFIEVAIHLVLYVRKIYPPGLFQRRRKYNVPVHICAHPELNKYIRRVVDDVKPMLEANQVDHIAIVIKNKENIPVESFVFKTQKGTANDICSKGFSETLERDLRTLLLKLSGSDSLLSDNPPDSTFSVEVCTSDTAAASATVATEQGQQVSLLAKECKSNKSN